MSRFDKTTHMGKEEKKERPKNYAENAKVNGSFMDIIRAIAKDTKKTNEEKRKNK